MNLKCIIGSLTAAGIAAAPAQAALVVDDTTIGQAIVVASSGHVVAKYEGASAGGVSELYLAGSSTLIFANDGTFAEGDTVDLGFFDAGTELIFKLHTTFNDDHDYFSGDALRNWDEVAHAAANTEGGSTFVGFEDIAGEGGDYDDLIFSFSNTLAAPSTPAVPEPASWALMIGGFMAAGIALRRRGAMRIRFS